MIELEHDRRYVNQWALNQRVLIDGFLPGTWVDFSHLNDCKTGALTTEAYVEAGHVYANIPNVLLQMPGYLHVVVNPHADDMAHTPEERDIKIVRRKKPSYYIYTETPTVSYSSKVDIYWGVEHAGKTLVVDEDGYVKADKPKVDDNIATDGEVNDMFDDVFEEDEGNTGGDNPDVENPGTEEPGGENPGGDSTGDENTNGDNIATDEEVNDMFEDVFG